MVNSVPELSQRLVKALDVDYNVIDMRAVLEIIAILEQTSVTEELLKTTRLGKIVNVLRKKTSNEELANRAKGLVKKWRKIALPLSNGVASADQQLRTASSVVRNTNNNVHQYSQHMEAAAFRNGVSDRIIHRPDSRSQSPLVKSERPQTTIYVSDRSQSPMQLVQAAAAKRRPTSDLISQHNKFSDFTGVLDNQNSNSSLHSVISLDTSDADRSHAAAAVKHKKEKRSKKHKNLTSDFDSLSNTSESNAVYFPQRVLANAPPPKKSDLTFEGKINDAPRPSEMPIVPALPVIEAPAIQPVVDEKPAPKKRGRKKGSKLIGKPVVSSYSDIKQKIASISGKTKIKTTKELLADLQNRKSQGLSQSVTPTLVLSSSTTSPLVIEPPKPFLVAPKVLPPQIKCEPELEKINVVQGTPSTSVTVPTIPNIKKRPRPETPEQAPEGPITIQQILAQLPPIDRSFQWVEDPDEIPCTCIEHPASPIPLINTIASAPKRSIFDEDYEEEPPESQGQLVAVPLPPPSLPKVVEDPDCPAKAKYCDGPQNVTSDMLDRLHGSFIEGINGNRDHGGVSNAQRTEEDQTDVVPKYGTIPTTGGLYSPLPKNPGSESDCVLVHSNIQFSERNSDDNSSSSLCPREDFKEWHEVVQRRSYRDELITVLPYVVID